MGTDRAASDARAAPMRRVAGLLYLIGFATTIAAMLLPHSPQADLLGFAWLAGAMALIALLLLAYPRRLPFAAYQAAMFAGTIIVSLTLYFNGERLGGPAADNEVLYLWIALYAGYFFNRRQVLAQLVVLAGCYAGVLATIHPGQVGVTRWLITIGMVSTAATVVHTLKLHNDRLLARLSLAVHTDALTGLINRLGFDDSLRRELTRSGRTGNSLALIVADLDNFKGLNDRLGHPAGDAALRAVGEVSLGLGRAGDTMARIGGDEFAAILPDTDAEGAYAFAERLRIAIGELRGLEAPLTISFGVAVARSGDRSPEALIRAADRALYEAKALGRDRSVIDDEQDAARPMSLAVAASRKQ
ncbi:MAG: GGDEF domain-containing protein [Solirubrobacteraceae bacterium]